MTGPESNKIFAAFLIAGITAYLAAFVGDKLVKPKKLETNAIEIEGAELEASGASAVLMPEPIMHLIANADIAQGERLSRACAACHTFNSGGATMIGPNLWNSFGNDKARVSGFAYSNTLAEMPGNWGYNELNWFLWRPRAYVEGTKMNYIGLRKPEDRAAMIAWLRTLSDSPKALPTQAQIDAEKAELSPPEPEETADANDAADAVDSAGESDTAQN